ncbi:hypothetical protein [Paenibacillus pinihumi]|uniref:hypothetical protein n=1 Tax=Paenibacillus pinihumi TaxID=669462 RepID=UPI000421FF9E|nr:hypothetical protein [Paenibacillus pinihumi]
MASLQTHLEYNDPLIMLHRSGKPGDELKPRSDSLPIINHMITLLETPSEFHKVQISNMTEITMELFHQKRSLEPNEFVVNYTNGIITFHPSLEGHSKICSYMGRGLIMYPASKIYAMASRNPDVVVTLQDYIVEIQNKLNDAHLAMERVEAVISEARMALDKTYTATDNANRSADAADQASAAAWDAYKTTRLVFMPPAADETQMKTMYPLPEVGWTVQTYTDGKRYRYDGRKWELIDIFGSGMLPVNEHKDGLMSVAEHLKLKSIPLEVKEKVMVFCMPYVYQGPQETMIMFPFHGEIVSIDAICGMAGETDTEIYIEKTRNLKTWTSIMKERVRFRPQEQFDDRTSELLHSSVEKGDIFRVHIARQGMGIQNITLEMKIRI